MRKEDVTQEALDKETRHSARPRHQRRQAREVAEKMVEGRMDKFYEEVCLLEQPFVKEQTMTIEQLVKTKIAKLGENITRRAIRPLQSGRNRGRTQRRRASGIPINHAGLPAHPVEGER